MSSALPTYFVTIFSFSRHTDHVDFFFILLHQHDATTSLCQEHVFVLQVLNRLSHCTFIK